MRHLEIKISEAGPFNQRVQPSLLSRAFREMKKDKQIHFLAKDPVEIIGALGFGRPGDQGKWQRFTRLYNLHHKYTQKDEFCGFHLEKLLFDTVLQEQAEYKVIGSGPIFTSTGLKKVAGSEVLFYDGNSVFKAEDGAGLDLFMEHRKTSIPIGLEAKNIREWIYPASYEVWRMIAKACTLKCLPVLAARKISYITKAGFFSKAGIMGFETQFQYFSPEVNAHSKYKFREIIDKDGLGYADIKLTNDVPRHFTHFFSNILPNHVAEYYDRFMRHREVLMKYAIDKELAEDKMNGKQRYELYCQFKLETGIEDPGEYHVNGSKWEDDGE